MASVTCVHVPLATLSHLAFPTGNAREGCKGRGPRAGASDTPHLTLPLPPKGRATLILIVKDGAWHVPALVYSAIEVSCCIYILHPRRWFGAPLRARGCKSFPPSGENPIVLLREQPTPRQVAPRFLAGLPRWPRGRGRLSKGPCAWATAGPRVQPVSRPQLQERSCPTGHSRACIRRWQRSLLSESLC